MSTENNLFRDYCKAENSEDEENIIDLQSRLYAEVYYAPTAEQNSNTKGIVNPPKFPIDDKPTSQDGVSNRCHKKADGIFYYDDSFSDNDNFYLNESKPCIELLKNSGSFKQNDMLKPEPVETKNEFEGSPSELYDNLTEKLDQCSEKDVKPMDNVIVKPQMTCHEMTNISVVTEARTACSTDTSVIVKSEIEPQDDIETRVEENNNPHVPLSNTDEACDQVSTKDNTDSKIVSGVEPQDVVSKEEEIDPDILKKYDFSKPFINQLYLVKYEELEQRLRDEAKEEEEQEELNADVNVTDETETDTRYTILRKGEKKKRGAIESSDEVTVISENDSDSEDSILEVPIPPKPKPPIIHLQDSDEDYVTLSSDGEETNEEHLNIVNLIDVSIRNTRSVARIKVQNKKKKAQEIQKSPIRHGTIATDSSSVSLPGHNEDILLNCTEVQKGASTINEIKAMSKVVKSEKLQLSLRAENVKDISKPLQDFEKNKLNTVGEKSWGHTFVSNMDNCDSRCNPDRQTVLWNPPLITTSEGNSSHHRDGNSMDNTSKRKRQCGNDEGMCSNPKQAKHSNKKDDTIQASTTQQNESNQKGKPESWEAYIFRPMSDKLRAFYTESRGQENFDINEIQSNMSKDPRLWAILDEDLMPSPSRRQRFWNVKCTHCRREGHQRHSCPEPYKPPQCHICGMQGHTETRCPQKMCLTCGKKQGTFRKTCESCRTLFCNMCKAVGHNSSECPDLWRRFHQTIRISEINIPENLTDVMKPADLLFCCNCTKRGHDSSTCNEYRWSQHFPTPVHVSNYKDGPKYANKKATTSQEMDMIPLSKTHNPNVQEPQNKAETEKRDVKENVIYACGTRAMKKKGYVIEQHINPTQYHLTGLLERRTAPYFLEKLLNVARFEVKIYFNEKQKLMLRVRGLESYSKFIYRFALHWLELEEEEKGYPIYINLSPNRAEMVSLLSLKLGELNKNLQDPTYLWDRIVKLKKEVTRKGSGNIKPLLYETQVELLKVYHVHLTKSKTLSQLRNIVENLKQSKSKTLRPEEQMQILLLYNKIFTAHTPANIKNILNVDDSKQIQQRTTNNSKKKMMASNIYEMFLAGLKGYKKSTKQQKVAPSSNNTVSNKNATNAVKDISVTGNIQHKQSTAGTSNTYPIETIQLPRTEEAEINVPNVDTVDQIRTMVSTNLIPIPLVESTVTNNEPRCSSSIALNPRDDDIIEVIHVESNTTETIKGISDIAQNVSNNPSKKKKSKKAKKKLSNNEQAKVQTNVQTNLQANLQTNLQTNVQTNVQVKQKPILKSTELLIRKAKKVIQEAFAFQLPYMNKAAAEVEKRLGDDSIRAKHIDVLEKLVNLEKHHQKHINSFYSYLE